MFNAHSAMLDITHCVKIFQSGLPRQNGSGDVCNAEESKSKSQTFTNFRGAPDLKFSNPARTGFTGFAQKFAGFEINHKL